MHEEISLNADVPVPEVNARSACYFIVSVPSNCTNCPHFMNHCEQCRERNADRAIHEEFPGAFSPLAAGPLSGLRIIEVPETLEAHAAGFAAEPAFLARVPGIR